VTLTFPNKSRSFDESRNAVRFSGYDGMFEVRFLVEANALRTASQPGRSEDECLRAFDMAREIILEAATHAYGRGGKDRYTLTAQDIRR
jgi:imidazolonepropionase-like amidohydrolase